MLQSIPFFFSPIFTLSFYPFHCNHSKSNTHHSESLPQSLFQALYWLQSISRRVISLSLLFARHSTSKSFTSSLVSSPIMCKSSYHTTMYLLFFSQDFALVHLYN